MAKRQKRYNTPELIANSTPELSGKKVNIVFKNGQVKFVTLLHQENGHFVVVNMRGQKASVAQNEIAEIILDYRG
ncbi:MAG: hypothetical protein R3345_09040 [Fulvivirga sp.]|nr:hypothetical protein [Fulvivirga sp.]